MMNLSDINIYLLLENIIFVFMATILTAILIWVWRNSKPYAPPQPFPTWSKIWFASVQILGIFPPLIGLVLCGLVWNNHSGLVILGWYFFNLAAQILWESLTLRKYKTVVWIIVPYIYLPYRLWQLYESLGLLNDEPGLLWVRSIVILEIVVWLVNYILDMSQLPRLFRWESSENSQVSSS
ncbi:MAG TPA: hypothetical protein VK203_15635 [Nostocaceae cyanobacterium]|nr:hypothetical protein [Nostocaceae cyanobacterium]